MPQTGPTSPPTGKYCSCFPAASPIPRIADGLIASGADVGRRQQAFQRFIGFLGLAVAFLDDLVLALPGNGGPRRNTFLDRVQSPGIVGLAWRRHAVLIAIKTVFQAVEIEIDAAASVIDILAAALAQYGCFVSKAHRFRRRQRGRG